MFTLMPSDSKTPDVCDFRILLGKRSAKSCLLVEKEEDLSRRQAGRCSRETIQDPYQGSQTMSTWRKGQNIGPSAEDLLLVWLHIYISPAISFRH